VCPAVNFRIPKMLGGSGAAAQVAVPRI
jgi:hypothetical protein